MLSLAVAALSFSANGHTAPLMKLRGGGLPSVEDTQKARAESRAAFLVCPLRLAVQV